MLSIDDLALMQEALEASLPEMCVIKRQTLTGDGAGGHTASPTTVATVACCIGPIAAREAMISEKLVGIGHWTVTLPAGTDALKGDSIESGGRTLKVEGVLGPRSYEVSRRVICTEAKNV